MNVVKDFLEVAKSEYTAEEIVQMANEQYDLAESNPEMYLDKYKSEVEDFAIKHEVCPKCSCYMTLHSYKEKREYQEGFVSENFVEFICPDCGSTY